MSFDVKEGEICALLGPSGCGKSTVLRLVAGLEDPTSGAMFLDGKEIAGPDKSRGMVFQRYTSFDWMTVQKNVEYGMRINGVPRAERNKNAERFIQLVKLTKFRNAYPRELSGGMQQRVAIARTLANGPSILLMDEPFGALDAETKWQMQELMIGIVEKSNGDRAARDPRHRRSHLPRRPHRLHVAPSRHRPRDVGDRIQGRAAFRQPRGDDGG